MQDVAEQVGVMMVPNNPEACTDKIKISPMAPLIMLIFCIATNFLLLTILICLLSKSYDKV
jgi:hypothetical protein